MVKVTWIYAARDVAIIGWDVTPVPGAPGVGTRFKITNMVIEYKAFGLY